MCFVWMFRICTRPSSSGRLISTWTSRRPGLSSASSMRSIRFVIPMRRMLLSESTPSIFDSSWLTMLSWTPVLSFAEPRDLQMESISSNITTWSCEFSPCILYSFSASANKLRMFSSAWPTYLFKISGPFTILGSAALRNFASCLAINVLPVPGGPCSSIPRTWLMPRSRMTWGGNVRAAKARRKMFPNSFERPPIPSSSKLKSGRNMLLCWTLLLRTWSLPEGPCTNSNSVMEPNEPAFTLAGAEPLPRSTGSRLATLNFRSVAWTSSTTNWPWVNTNLENLSVKTFSRSSSVISRGFTALVACRLSKKSTSSLQDPRSKAGGGTKRLTRTSSNWPILALSRCILLRPMVPVETLVCASMTNTKPLSSTY
mmetsp:Transcript_11509/g.26199  ORF Transcript_11509/g.26199 Transcript_11509/m.26199 type:complete len:371 (-) Transcript_11509:200-1312(-)